MIRGPGQYIPPVEVSIIDRRFVAARYFRMCPNQFRTLSFTCHFLYVLRKATPLSKNEGVYVRDVQSGKVRAVMGPQSYLLTAYEVLWEKELSSQVDFLLQ